MSTSETQRTDGLIEALKVRLDIDERIARATLLTASDDGDWIVCYDRSGEPNGVVGTCIHIGVSVGGDLDEPAQAFHIARQNPARTLAMVAAHREILELHKRSDEVPWYSVCDRCGTPLEYPVDWPCPTIKALAKGYGIEVQE